MIGHHRRRDHGRRAWLGLVLTGCLTASVLALLPPSAVANATTHVVRAGWTSPAGANDKFVYTAYYPTELEVHRGDLVEWQFPASYGGWHTVSFTHGDVRPPAWRADEYPGVLGMADAWAYGHERGDDDVQCGRFSWHYAPDGEQEPCVLTADDIDDPGDQFSSSLLDRFFATTDAGSFVAEIDLPQGTYSYFCKIHPQMQGELEVLAGNRAVDNPTEAELVAQRDADHANAKARSESLSKRSWNPLTREWTVWVGAETTDGRVEILDYLPGKVTARRGDTVRFLGGTQEPNTVTFTSAPQGGFSFNGDCTATTCTGTGTPHGLAGFAFVWFCDPDDSSAGVPGVPLAFMPSRVADDRAKGAIDRGCVEVDGAVPTRVEMGAGPTMASSQPAPSNLVVGADTWHNSGMLFASHTDASLRDKPDGTSFPTEFEARFPTAGAFPYVCIAHEFMRGQIDVV